MCNTYVAKPLKGAAGWKARVSDDIGKLKSALIRKSLPGVVVLADGHDFQPSTMRWGFHRPFNPSINNSRSNKLDSGMWKKAFTERRCIIPVSSYYEWGEGTAGKKQAYEISGPSDWIWIAGIWEENTEHGLCYSMITTAAAPSVDFIHERMPAVLPWTKAEEFLTMKDFPFTPFPGQIQATPCESPLIRKKPTGPKQGSLF